MAAEPIETRHPLLTAVAAVRAGLGSVRDVSPLFLAAEEKAELLEELARAEAELSALRLCVLAVSADVAAEAGVRDLGIWLHQHTHCGTRSGRADQALADTLDGRYPRLVGALAAGRANLEQVRVIVHALEALPDRVTVEVRDLAETELLRLCAQVGPDELRRVGRRILEVVAPELYVDAEAKRLLDEEQGARKKMRITFKDLGDGTTRVTQILPDSVAARLRTYLEAYTSPRHDNATRTGFGTGFGEADRIPYPRKLAQAFCALLEHLDPAKLPSHGGDATTVMVTVPLAHLTEELATAGLIDGGGLDLGANLTAAEARRLACTAKIIPAVLGNHGEILDLGRADRLFRPAQRRAMRLRDQTCRAEDCDHPATWCEAHHLRPWAHGGRTDLADGILLCPFDHHRIHDPTYDWEQLPNRKIRFTKKRR